MRLVAVSTLVFSLTACGDDEVVRPRSCGVDGPIDLLPVEIGTTVSAVSVGERIIATARTGSVSEVWSIDRCGDEAVLLDSYHQDDEEFWLYGGANGDAVRCNSATGAVEWVDPYDEREPHALFESAEFCVLWPIAGGLAAYDPTAFALQFIADPSAPDPDPIVLADDYSESFNPLKSTGSGSSWPELGARRAGTTRPLVVGERMLFNDADERFVEKHVVTGETRVIWERFSRDFQLLADGKHVMWNSWCTVDEPSSACSGTQVWDIEAGSSTKRAPFMLVSDLAEPWISLDIGSFKKDSAAVHLRVYNLDDGERHTFASELLAPPARVDRDWAYFRPWRLEASLSPEVMVVSVPSDPFTWEEDPAPHLYWPYTGELRALDLPYDPHPIKTEAGIYWTTEGLRLLNTTGEQIDMMTESRSHQIVMADGRAAQTVDGALHLFSPDGSSMVLDDEVSDVYIPRSNGAARDDLEDLFYVADGMFRRFPLP